MALPSLHPSRPLVSPQAGSSLTIVAHGATVGGIKTVDNEDSFRICFEKNLFMVADGLASPGNGLLASQMAVQIVQDSFSIDNGDLIGPFKAASAILFEKSQREPELTGMSTTLAALYLERGRRLFHVAHVGDSRVYLIRNELMLLLTEDHSHLNEWRRNPVGPRPSQSHLTQAIGHERSVDVDVDAFPFEAGDLFLLCSDGLNKVLKDEPLLQILLGLRKAHRDLQVVVDWLIQEASDRGNKDDATAVLVQISL